jgi:hypothetical protein
MHKAISTITTLAACASFFASYAADAPPSNRSTHLAERFHFYCLESAPDFQKIGTRSTAMGLKVIDDRAVAMPDGSQLHQKNWLVPDTGGEFVLMSLTEGGGPKMMTRCGIAATDANGAVSDCPIKGRKPWHAGKDCGRRLAKCNECLVGRKVGPAIRARHAFLSDSRRTWGGGKRDLS